MLFSEISDFLKTLKGLVAGKETIKTLFNLTKLKLALNTFILTGADRVKKTH
jgi:hypothetical protein